MSRQIILTSQGKHEAARKDLDENQSENQMQEKSSEKVKKIEKLKRNKGTLIVDKVQVEFGAKPGVSIQNGYARINTLSWEAYNEGNDLKRQVEDYKRLNGCYPKIAITDKIYGTRGN